MQLELVSETGAAERNEWQRTVVVVFDEGEETMLGLTRVASRHRLSTA